MQPSSPSTSHCSQVPIKVQHKLAKKKIIRRRRLDLDCGCSYYLHINCTNHGFTHRGTHHCSSGNEWRFYLGDKQSPLFQDHQPQREATQHEQRHNFNTNPIQSQHQEGVGDSQMFSQLPNLDDLTASDWSFLKSI
ncbi:Transcriptional activator protein [Tomato yellow leaf curl Saudi virus]|uniref:transcriptional activator protein n=1 Tax=Tomato yellow leaf curl Saudi virus TaxID=1391746 RepID=UPI000390640E|nr:Transcriptional activator protein [Tomato yellow leaf curl Saudi virus]AGU13646.1 Transcriptional activator protein [Tomato yellow leaf curl Saudi virus]WPM94641.1 transcriptional activator protein [Tomato yellow leaf curl virus]